MATQDSSWQRASCSPLVATLLLGVTFGGAWLVTGSTAGRALDLLRHLIG